jgi:hypothetical protein
MNGSTLTSSPQVSPRRTERTKIIIVPGRVESHVNYGSDNLTVCIASAMAADTVNMMHCNQRVA